MENRNTTARNGFAPHPAQPADEYPALVRRYQVLLLDFMFLGGVLILLLFLTEGWSDGPLVVRMVFLPLLLLYEPVLTAYSATFGQWALGIRVRQHKRPEERIRLWQAYVRLLFKYVFGWVSFISIHFNPKRRAIHDLYSGSVMVRVRKEPSLGQIILPEPGV